MRHHRTRFVGLLIIVAALVFAPGALAAPANGPGAAKAKERVYGKHCGAKRTGSRRPAERAKCLEAMSKLATGKSSSPRKACRALSRKKARGGRRSAFARCVSAGAKLLKSKGRGDGASATDDEGDDPDDDSDYGDGDGDGGDGDDDGADSGDDPDDPDAALDDAGADDSPAGADRGAVDPDDDLAA
jgi:hypothetical protein